MPCPGQVVLSASDAQVQRRAGCRVEVPLEGSDWEVCKPREFSEVRV